MMALGDYIHHRFIENFVEIWSDHYAPTLQENRVVNS